MVLKIHLDAGHYGKYNQSPCNKAYYESEKMWTLQNLLKKYLEEYGITVTTTRKDQTKDLAVIERGKSAKGCDLFISLHSNAVGSNKNEDVDYVRAYVPLNKSGDTLGKKLVNIVADIMQTKQVPHITTREGDHGEYYGVMRGANAVGVPVYMIIEHSFHTNTRSTNWLLNDSNLDKLAKAEADTIAKHYGLSKQGSKPSQPDYEKFGRVFEQVINDINALESVKALRDLVKN